MAKHFYVKCVLIFFLSPFYCKAGVIIELLKPADSLISPGTNQTIIFKLINAGEEPVAVKIKTQLPLPVRQVLCPKTAIVDPAGEKNLFFTVNFPKNTPHGNLLLTFTFASDSSLETIEVPCHVARVTSLFIQSVNLLPYARAGESITTQYLVTNMGNSTENLLLKSFYTEVEGDKQIVLPPDSNKLITLYKKTDPDLKIMYDQSFDLQLLDYSSGNQIKAIQKSVKIYPVKATKNDPYHRIPLNFSTSYLTRYTDNVKITSAYQFEISGMGTIDSAGKHQISYLYRGPDQQNIARIGRFAQRYAGYDGPRLSVYLGERSYSTTMLTDMFRFGTGLELGYKPNTSLRFSAYYMKPRFQPEIVHIAAFSSKFVKSERLQFTTGLVMKQLRNAGSPIFLHSVSAEYYNQKSFKGFTEWSTAYGHKKPSVAGHIQAEFNRNSFRYATDALFASAFFPGYFNNSLTLSNSLGYGIKNWRIGAGYNYNDANPQLDTLFGVAPISKALNVGLGYNFPKKHLLMMQYIARNKTDRFASKKFDYEEKAARTSFNHTGERWVYAFAGEYGYTLNRLLPENANLFKAMSAQFNISYSKDKKNVISAYVNALRNARFNAQLTNYLLYGAMVNIRSSKKITIALQYQNTFLIDELYTDKNLFDARFSYRITPHQTVSVYANYGILFRNTSGRDFYGLASYNLQLNVPVKKVSTYGSVHGKITQNNADKIEGILLFMGGQTAVTNKNGEFLFNNIKPGFHTLLIERSSYGVKDVPDTIFPLSIEVFPAKKTQVSFGLIKAADIEGDVMLVEKTKVVQSKNNVVALPQFVVEISDSRQTILTTTNANGHFSYKGLAPGAWKVRIVPTGWTGDFVMTENEVNVKAESGKVMQVQFEISPKVRQIKFKNTAPVEIKK